MSHHRPPSLTVTSKSSPCSGEQPPTVEAPWHPLTQPHLSITRNGFHMGSSPIHFTAAKGHKEIVALLLENGADAKSRNYCGQRITEQTRVVPSLDPKPIEGDCNGAGCHTNYSTKSMREDGGFEVIKKAILNVTSP